MFVSVNRGRVEYYFCFVNFLTPRYISQTMWRLESKLWIWVRYGVFWITKLKSKIEKSIRHIITMMNTQRFSWDLKYNKKLKNLVKQKYRPLLHKIFTYELNPNKPIFKGSIIIQVVLTSEFNFTKKPN